MFRRLRFLPLVTACAALAWPARAGAQAPPANPTSVPPEKGSLDESGKFVPPPAEPPSGTPLPPADPAAAEAALKKALKVEEPAPGHFKIGLVSFTKADRTVNIPATVNMRGGVVEYLLVTEKGKTHEALLTTKASPQDFHTACLLVGAKPAMPVAITATWETNGPAAVVPLTYFVTISDGTKLPEEAWPYGGSRFTPQGGFAAQIDGSFISLISDSNALVSNPGPSRSQDDIHFPNAEMLPRAGLPITLVFKFQTAPAASSPPVPKPR